MGYSFMLRSPNQTTNQIRRSYKNDHAIKYFRDCLFRDMKVAITDICGIRHTSSVFLIWSVIFLKLLVNLIYTAHCTMSLFCAHAKIRIRPKNYGV